MEKIVSKSVGFIVIALLTSILVGCDQLNIGGEKDSAGEQSSTNKTSAPVTQANNPQSSSNDHPSAEEHSEATPESAQGNGQVPKQKGKQGAPAAQQNAGKQPPPPEVAVIEAQPQTVTLTENLPARLEASREAVVRARVNGIVEKRLFTEGSRVKAGDLLYKIDDAPYQANLLTAKAQRQQAEANRQLAQSTVNRYAPLVREKAISRQQYDQAKSEVLLAQANINAAEAAIKQANINVNYARVSAPISGFIGKSFVTEGALVNAAQGTEMARIQQLDPMYINISQSAGDVMRLKKAIDNGSLANTNGETELEITFEDGTLYPHKGTLLFTDQTVDESTGELLVRAEIPNPNNDLLPGLYVRVDMPLAAFENAYLIPQQAVTRSNDNSSVIVVNEDGSFAPKPVKVARAQGTNWIVTDGLEPGDKVLVEGQMRLRGAQKVTPVPWEQEKEQENNS